MRWLCVLVLALAPAAAGAAPAVGSAFDPGGSFITLDGLLLPTCGNPRVDRMALRFVAHASLPVRDVSLGVDGHDNPSSGDASYQVDVVPALSDGGPDDPATTSIWEGFFNAYDYSGGPTFVAAGSATEYADAQAGSTYFVLVQKTSGGAGVRLRAAPTGSAIDPIWGIEDAAPRTVLAGTSSVSNCGSAPPVLQSWADLGREPVFVIRYDDPNGACPSVDPTLLTESPGDGEAYLDVTDVAVTSGTNFVGDWFDAYFVGDPAAYPLRVFGAMAPLSVNGSDPVSLYAVNWYVTGVDAGAVGGGTLVDTGAPYLGGAYHWHRAIFTSAAQPAFDFVGGYPAELFITNGATATVAHVPELFSGDTDSCSVVQHGQFQGGYQRAYAFDGDSYLDGGASEGFYDYALDGEVPFRLCASELPGNGVDEDCSGFDESAGQLYTACVDQDGDGHGVHSGHDLQLSSAFWATPPSGYAADCCDTDDGDPSVGCGTTTSSTTTTTTTTTTSTTTASSTATSASSTSSTSTSSTSSTTSSTSGSSGSSTSTTGSSASSSGASGAGSSSASSSGSGASTTTATSAGSSGAGAASSTVGSSSGGHGSTSGANSGSGSTAAGSGAAGASGGQGAQPVKFALSGCGCGGASAFDLLGAAAALLLLRRRTARS